MKAIGTISSFRVIPRLFAEITFSHTSWGSVLSRAVRSAHLASPYDKAEDGCDRGVAAECLSVRQ
jgi:hypothetical protein